LSFALADNRCYRALLRLIRDVVDKLYKIIYYHVKQCYCGIQTIGAIGRDMRLFLKKMVCSVTISLILSFLIAGCTFMQLREETKIIQNSTILVGNVTSTPSFWDRPIVVAAYSKENNTRAIVHYTTLHEQASYELIVPKGSYYIVAFGDKNKNLIYDIGEPAGQYLGVEPLSAPAGRMLPENRYCRQLP